MKVFALTHPTHGVVEFDESFEKIVRLANIYYQPLSLVYADIEKKGLNYFVFPKGLVRRSDGTPCGGDCEYCKRWHLKCPHGINL